MRRFPKTAGGNLRLMGQRWGSLLGKAASNEKKARRRRKKGR